MLPPLGRIAILYVEADAVVFATIIVDTTVFVVDGTVYKSVNDAPGFDCPNTFGVNAIFYNPPNINDNACVSCFDKLIAVVAAALSPCGSDAPA